MLRAGPFSDERIIRLANRRFIPFYFDLSNRGFAADPDARDFVVAKKERYGGRSVPTPNLLFMTPDGELVGEVGNYASEGKVLATMMRVLRENADYAEPTAAERRATAIEQARIRMDLQDAAGARAALADDESAHAHYLLARLDRLEAQWNSMREHLAKVDDEELADDVRMEAAYEHWVKRDFRELGKALADFPKDSDRYTEARYYEGLAHFHRGDVETAQSIWKSTIKACAQDPWIYRADWAYCNAKQGKSGRRAFSSSRKGPSLLGRIGYMGRRNPDLRTRNRK